MVWPWLSPMATDNLTAKEWQSIVRDHARRVRESQEVA